ncbi:MAG: hypothetical protein ACI4MH_04650 [Candidatus Coproplasma sp.]
MKRIYRILLALVILCATVLPVAACGEATTTVGGSATGASDIEISDPVFGFVKAENYNLDPENFDINSTFNWATLQVDTTYYLFVTFDVTARRNNDGQSLLHVNFTFDALEIMDGTMEDVSSGMIVDMTFKDALTGHTGKTTTISFKIPSQSTNPKTINMIVSLKPVQIGESHIIIGYDYDAPGYNLLGSDGYTKNLTVASVQIETPVLSVTSMGALQWKNVKNADYYCIYESGSQSPIRDFMGNIIYVLADGVSVGGVMTFNIGLYIQNYHTLVIRAFSNDTKNILMSDFSNAIEFTW